MVSKSLCIAIHSAMGDEARDAKKYDELSRAKELSGIQSISLSKIKRDEAKHHRELFELFQQLGCEVEDTLLEREQYLLSKEKRIRRAQLFVSQF